MVPAMSARRESLPRELLSYVEVPIRRPLQVLLPLLAVTSLALVLAYTLPRQYRTATLILVEAQEVPKSFVQTTENPARPRLLTIRQEILSRTRLEQVIKELDPYPERTGKAPMTEVIEAMRGAVSINVKGEDAFTIEYVHGSPSVAQAVANRLAGLFIQETMRAREEQVTSAVSFIETQLEDARRELEQKEQALRRYKEARMGSLPEQTNSNLATLQRLQLEQQSLAASLQSARQRLTLLEQGSGDPGFTPGSSSRREPSSELSTLRARLAELEERYTNEHPDIQSLRARIARLEGNGPRNSEGGSEATGFASGSPLLDQARLEVKDLELKIANVDKRIQVFQQRVEETPRAEQELANLTRDHQLLKENYLQLLNKKLDAQMAERLEQRWKGEQFRVLDPAFLPEEPYSPNRRVILLLGIAVGLLSGLAFAYASEFLDSSVKGAKDLEVLAPLPLLGFLSAVQGRTGTPTPPGLLSGLRHLLQRRRQQANPFRDGAGSHSESLGERETVGPTSPSRRPPVFQESEAVSNHPREGVAAAVLARGAIFEQFRAIAARIRALDADRPLRCIGVVSAVAGEGKSTAAMGLAAALGQGSARVLLVEADVRRPALSDYLGVPQAAGLAEWLLGSEEPVSVRRVLPSRFFFLPAGLVSEGFENGAFIEAGEVEAMRALVEEARRSFDFVIVDCPPLIPVADAMVLQEMVDGLVLVVRERHAPIETILHALDRVDAERLRGVVLNDHLDVLRRYQRYQQSYYRKAS